MDSLLFDPNLQFKDLLKPNRYKIYYGGRGSGKSFQIAEALIRITDVCKIRVLCARELQGTLADSVHHLLVETISRLGMENRFTITQNSIRSAAGSEIIFRGLRHNYTEIKSMEDVTICWIEEGASMSEESWDVLDPTIRSPGSEIWISLNPENEDDFIFKKFIKNPPVNAVVHKVNHDSNPFFPKELQIQMDQCKEQDYDKFEWIWLGNCRKISDAVIFKNRVFIEEFDSPEKADFLHGLDFGYGPDPTAFVRCYVKDDELFIDYSVGGYGIELDEYGPVLRQVTTAQTWKIFADSASPGNISLIKRQGFNIEGVKKWAGSIEDGISHLKSYKRIVVHPRCTELINEFRNYKWKQDRVSGVIQPIPGDNFNHYIDALRYALNKYIIKKGTSTNTWEMLSR